MKILDLTFVLLLFLGSAAAQQTPFERSGKKETTTYEQVISYYQNLAKKFPKQARLVAYGTTDFGRPLHVLVLSKKGGFSPDLAKKNGSVLLINNGIHPGEPEGIDASMMLARDLLQSNSIPENVTICIIPIYNIGGSHNRTATSRANQNGPLFYGFRGNSKNYDLNRDFIKTDSKNAAAFQSIFNHWKPEVLVDTHTSNGADYQYTMTLIPTQKDKLNTVLSGFLTRTFIPYLYQEMERKGYPLVPYVNAIEETPDSGITGFMESPRYSTGYAALHNVIGFMPETHMLKPFDKRVEATYVLLQCYIDFIKAHAKDIIANKRQADEAVAMQQNFPLSWKLDRSQYDSIAFKGFEAKYKPSDVSGLSRLYYDRNAPYTKYIKQWNHFEPALSVEKPVAYVIPKAWDKVIALLKSNNVKMDQFANDVTLDLSMYYIKDYKSAARPYEGHYLHSDVKLEKVKQRVLCYAGDYVVYVNQPSNRYVVETLEPQATDSFFNWNFFDSVLGQKEHFSAYVFEDTAAQLLEKDPALKKKLKEEQAKDPAFSKNANAQLEFIYKNSDYFENTFMRYPIGRLETPVKLNLR